MASVAQPMPAVLRLVAGLQGICFLQNGLLVLAAGSDVWPCVFALQSPGWALVEAVHGFSGAADAGSAAPGGLAAGQLL
jgi:hypothetical protein